MIPTYTVLLYCMIIWEVEIAENQKGMKIKFKLFTMPQSDAKEQGSSKSASFTIVEGRINLADNS